MRTPKGYTIVEVMVAIMILSVTMLFGLTFFTFSNKSLQIAKEQKYAVQFAKSALEQDQTTAYNLLASHALPNSTDPLTGVTYTCQVGIVTTANYKTLTATVNWQSHATGRARNLVFSTIRALAYPVN